MTFNFATAMRRATKLTRAGKSHAATRVMQHAIGGAMVKTMAASITSLYAVAPAKTKPAGKKRKSTGKAAGKNAPAPATPPTDRRLSAVVKQLRTAKALMPAPFALSGSASPAKAPVIPRGAQYLARTHSSTEGARDFRLYLPARQPGGPKGLIVMLHGCTQDPDDFATGTNMNTVAQKHGLAVAYPAQTRGQNAAACWNWFTPAHQSRGAGEPAIIAGLARELMLEFGLERDTVFVAGLSAGGAMAVILADTYPDVFSAAGVHSGLARGAAKTVVTALSAMRSGTGSKAPPARRGKVAAGNTVRRIIFQGDEDSTVHPSNAPKIVVGAVGSRKPAQVCSKTASGRDYVRSDYALADGTVDVELWQLTGAGHAWSGGKKGGSYTDPKGPDASAEMVRFFLSLSV